MTLEIPGQSGPGIRDLAVIQELQGLKISLVVGAAADTNISISAIRTIDTLVAVIEFSASFNPVNQSAATSITSNGNIQCTNNSTGNRLLVFWFDKDPND